ncbi:hypothetical protein [Streptomyces lavendulocolor]|uniref:hypothetical protein n=1 Tax=Streptomyces lavendulocolor TaxID=67316 RepID=UPI0031E437E1
MFVSAPSYRRSKPPTSVEFESTIDAIAAHNIAQVAAARRGVTPRPYVLSDGLADDDPNLNDLPTEGREVIETHKNENQEELKKERVKTQNLAEKRYSGEISASWFEEQMDAQTEHNIENYAKRERELARKLKDIGKKNPEAQSLIAQGYVSVSKFFMELWNKVVAFFEDLVQRLVDLWNKVKDWFEMAWKSVNDWWRVVFG